MRSRWPRLAAFALLLACACGRAADARLEPEPEANTDAEPADESVDEAAADAEAPAPAVDAQTAEAEIDAAIASARGRGEEDRLALAKERSELDALTKELDGRLAGIDQLEQRLDALVGVGKVAEERRRERIDVLANLLATMPPQAAATMLAQMSDVEAQELVLAVAQTDKRKAAKLIATMPAARAAAIGQRYLRRDPKALGDAIDPDATSDAAPLPATPASAPAPAPASAPAKDAANEPAAASDAASKPQEASP